MLDPYVLTVVIHGALLTNAPLLVLAFRFSLRDVWSHIAFFTINAGGSFIEFLFAAWANKFAITKWIVRNKPLCPELQAALNETFRQRISWTLVPVSLGLGLAIQLSGVYLWDGWRNRGIKYHPRAWTFVRPRWLVWTKEKWELQRITVSTVAVLIYILSIINFEYFILYDFHSHARQFSGISSSENGWSWGQMGAFLGELIALGIALRIWLIGVCTESVKLLRIASYVSSSSDCR